MKNTYRFYKFKILLKENRRLLLVFFLWFFLGFLYYYFVDKLGLVESFLASVFFTDTKSSFSPGYSVWTQGVVFGVVFVFFVQNIFEKYNPERGCRMLASKLKNHLVVIGYSHLGQRLVSYCQGRGKAYTLIEKDKEKVDELLRNGQPVVVDNACEGDALVDAGVKEARMVIITADNIETSLIVTKKAREMNPDCKILTRCYVDELSEVLESLGADEVVSSSKNVFENIVGKYNL